MYNNNNHYLSLKITLLIFYIICISNFYNICYKILSLICLTYILIFYFTKKFYYLFLFFLTIIPIISWFLEENYFYKKDLITTYEIYNYYPKKKNNKNFLYLASDGRKKFLLITCIKKKFFIKYSSILYTQDKNLFFYLENTIIKEIEPTGLNKIRKYIYEWINKKYTQHNMKDIKDYLHYIQTIILGIREDKNNNFYLFKTTGTWHLLCIGGLHINLLKRFILFIISLFFLNKPNKVYPFFYYIQIIILFLYGYISGFQIPALRSVLMNTINLVAFIQKYYINIFYRYFLSFYMLILWNKNFLYDFGFQMSFLAIYMIIIYGPYGKKFIQNNIKNKYYVILIENLYINILITIGVSLHSFLLHGSLNILCPIINMICIPLFTIAVISFFLYILLPIFGFIFKPLIIYNFKLLEWIIYIGDKKAIYIYGKIQKKNFNLYMFLFLIILIFLNYILCL